MHNSASLRHQLKPSRIFRLLLLEDNPTDVLLLHEALDSSAFCFEITHKANLAEGRRAIAAENFDAVIADLNLPDSSGLETILGIRSAAPDVATIVVTGSHDQSMGIEAIRHGAQGFLQKSELGVVRLENHIISAIERQKSTLAERERWRQAIEVQRAGLLHDSEVRSLEKLSKGPGTDFTARVYQAGALRESYPEQFDEAVRRYRALLEHSIERRIYKVDEPRTREVPDLAELLGCLRAGPRDVIELHLAALSECDFGGASPKSQAWAEEGHLVLLDLMGHLVLFYRNHYPALAVKRKGATT